MIRIRRLYKEPRGTARKLILTEKLLREFGMWGAENIVLEKVQNGQFRAWVGPMDKQNIIDAAERDKQTGKRILRFKDETE